MQPAHFLAPDAHISAHRPPNPRILHGNVSGDVSVPTTRTQPVGWRLGTTSEPCRNCWATGKSPPTMLQIAAYEARDHGVAAVHIRVILDVMIPYVVCT